MDEQAREKWRAALNATPALPLEAARNFLQTYFSDNSLPEARQQMNSMMTVNIRPLLAGLTGIEALLSNPPTEKGVLSHLVAYDANWVLDDPSDEGAKVWLREIAELIREVLGDKQPPRPGNALDDQRTII